MEVDTGSSGPNPYANYAVARVKESLWAGSYVGVMGIDKRSGNPLESFNQTGGVDTRLVFFKDWFVDAHMAGTQLIFVLRSSIRSNINVMAKDWL